MFQISKRRLWQFGLASVAGLSLQAGVVFAQDPAPIYTKHASLRMPVEMDARTRANLAEIKFYVQGPAGRWECALTASASQAAFDFKAPTDGEYKFTFVTVDRKGIATPANVEAAAAHRVVIVDTTPPEISVQPATSRGETLLQFQIRDANPDSHSLRALYQAADFTWKPLQPAGADTPTLFRLPSSDVLKSKIRVTAADRAGNRNMKEVDLGGAARSDGPPATVIDRGRPDPTLLPKDAEPYTAPIPPDVRGTGFTDPPKFPKIDQPSFPVLPNAPAIKFPDGTPDIKIPKPLNIKQPERPDVPIPNEPVLKIPVAPSKLPETPDLKLPDMPMTPLLEAPAAKAPIDILPPPALAPDRATLKPSDVMPPEVPGIEKKPVEKTASNEVLNTRSISINYELPENARSTKKTDFWATLDGGRSWKLLVDQSAGISPAKLTLPSDGVFGIRIRPNGGGKQPEPGEEIDCLVEIDSTAPAVNLQPPTIGSDEGLMILTWTASDTNLLGNSINLYYASKSDGPWNVIVSGYKNEGVYRWTLPANLSGPIYLRIEAMDRAGNVGQMELPSPVSVETGKQRVKVISVEPGK